MNVWVTVGCGLLSAYCAYVTWYRRRRDAIIDGTRAAAIAELERAGGTPDERLMTALANRDAEGVALWLSDGPQPDTLAIQQVRRYAEASRAARAYDVRHLYVTTGGAVTVGILMIRALGWIGNDVKAEEATALAANARMHTIGYANLVNHIDSGSGHTIVFVLYHPGPTTEAELQALGSAAHGGHGQRVEFYPVACCVSLEAATQFFGRSALPYRQRFVQGGLDYPTFYGLKALGVSKEPESDGYMSVIDPQGSMIAHWSALPDSSELRETLH
jgi:hypothetical protein